MFHVLTAPASFVVEAMANAAGLSIDGTNRMSGAFEPALAPEVERQNRFVSENQRRIFVQIYRIVGNVADAQDLTQETFIKALQRQEQLKDDQKAAHWLSRIALNVCRNAHRTRARKPELRWSDLTEAERVVLEAAMEAPGSAADDRADAARELLERALETLPPADQQVIRMLHLEEMEVAQIAAATGWSATGVRVRAFRARLRLKRALRDLGGRFQQ